MHDKIFNELETEANFSILIKDFFKKKITISGETLKKPCSWIMSGKKIPNSITFIIIV